VARFVSNSAAGTESAAYRRYVLSLLFLVATFNLIALSSVGSRMGTALIGIATDLLSSRYGDDAIRYSLLMSGVAALGPGGFRWQAAQTHEQDITAIVPDRSPEHQ
jgi:hypothetical protein